MCFLVCGRDVSPTKKRCPGLPQAQIGQCYVICYTCPKTSPWRVILTCGGEEYSRKWHDKSKSLLFALMFSISMEVGAVILRARKKRLGGCPHWKKVFDGDAVVVCYFLEEERRVEKAARKLNKFSEWKR